MNRRFVAPAIAALLLSSCAAAQTPPPPGGPGMMQSDDAPCDGPMKGGPHGEGGWHHHGPLADLPKPLTADAVKQALVAQEAKRPHVGNVVEKDANTLTVEMVGPDGKVVRQVDIDRNTGAPHPTR
jgi:hypothetical protein